ncbi:hypothetical protein ACKKBF_B10775 [Auxenochlorella protothecoides x Auxenochlorella symbiontica]|uniref:Cyclin-like domain-containing protein n=2 Tax=Auxenochlorella protothecoides TaxID=3075 RepID=A0A1D1ZS45_AUXPR
MKYKESSQCDRWVFTNEQLAELRGAKLESTLRVLTQAQESSSQASGSGNGDTPPPADLAPPSLEEQELLLRYYGSKLQAICAELKLPRKVLGTCVTFLKRMYVHSCVLEVDPQTIFLTCLYLACKTEESYISAAELGRLSGMRAEIVLGTELTLLQGLKFDLIVFSPFNAIEGFMQVIQERAQIPGAVEPALLGLQESTADRARRAALAAADALMLTDAPLLFTPGQLALAALRSGFHKAGIKIQNPAALVLSPDEQPEETVHKLAAVLRSIDELGALGSATLDLEEIAAIDRRVKACRAVLSETSRKAAKGKPSGKSGTKEAIAAKA